MHTSMIIRIILASLCIKFILNFDTNSIILLESNFKIVLIKRLDKILIFIMINEYNYEFSK